MLEKLEYKYEVEKFELLGTLVGHSLLKQGLTDAAGYIMVWTNALSMEMQGRWRCQALEYNTIAIFIQLSDSFVQVYTIPLTVSDLWQLESYLLLWKNQLSSTSQLN